MITINMRLSSNGCYGMSNPFTINNCAPELEINFFYLLYLEKKYYKNIFKPINHLMPITNDESKIFKTPIYERDNRSVCL